MKSKLGILIALLMLGYGFIRIGVGGALLAQSLEIINHTELADASVEVTEFITQRADRQLISFSKVGYFLYILFMGVLLSLGAIFALLKKKIGYTILWIYLGLHAALFINFLEINPKILVLILQIGLLFLLQYLHPPIREQVFD